MQPPFLSPWILKEPPDSTPPDASSYPNPWAQQQAAPSQGGPSTLQLPANRSWDPGALADNGQIDSRTEWDYLVLAGMKTPGIASVKASKKSRLDRKETPGNDGETLTHLGVRSGEIQVRILLLTQTDLDAWAKIVPLLQPQAGKDRPDPVAVDHPGLKLNGIKSLYVEDLGIPQSTGPGGPLEVNIRFVEFLKTKAGVKTMTRTKVVVSDNPKAATPKAAPKPSSSAAP